ncbi:MAG: preprotein translocase subunit SecY [Candidatus Gastranaerophilales bacterium]|nr:preprotein translocase subunit SecY [Candidatus Gastranaerophilales bacterium]
MKLPTFNDIVGNWEATGLKSKLIFTFVMIVLFRLGAQIPLFGINNQVFMNLAAGNNIIGFLDMFSGGALGRVSIFALGIGPYITASIIMQLMTAIIPHLETLQKEDGEAGRRKISQYTRIFTVFLAMFQSTIFIAYLHKLPNSIMPHVNPALFSVGAIIALTAGSMLVMWLAELITEKGIGNGGSMLIFVGIIAGIPLYMDRTATLIAADPTKQFALFLLLVIFLATLVLIVIMQDAVRKVVIINPKRQVGNKVYGGVNTFIPFKLNPSGVMPIIFAIAILLFPQTILGVLGNANIPIPYFKGAITFISNHILNPNKIPYYLIYFGLIFSLTFFYASIMPNMQPKDIANNLKKSGSSIPGVKPGKPTADALDKIISRITFLGALGLGIIALIPNIASGVTGITTLQGIGSTSLIIMVGVALDLINQIKSYSLSKQYEGFLKK